MEAKRQAEVDAWHARYVAERQAWVDLDGEITANAEAKAKADVDSAIRTKANDLAYAQARAASDAAARNEALAEANRQLPVTNRLITES